MQTSLGARLKQERLRRGLTITQVSEGSGVARNTLTQVEHGQRNPTTPTVRKLTDFYGLDYGALFEEVYGDPKAPTPPALESSRAGVAEVDPESDEDVQQALYRVALSIFKSRIKQIRDFEELSPTERREVFEDVWYAIKHLRNPRMFGTGDNTMLLHEALVQSALRMIAVYDLLDLKEGQAEGAEVFDIKEARRALLQEAS